MKTKITIFFIILCFFAAACSSKDEGIEYPDDNDNTENNSEPEDNSLPDAIVDDSENETPDEKMEPEITCYTGGGIVYEGAQQFKICETDPEKFQKQLCAKGGWKDDGECISGTVTIPGGSFKMGCDKELEKKCPNDAKPPHEVALSSYVIDKFEVTVELFEKCIQENICNNDDPEKPHYRTSEDLFDCNIGNDSRKNHPVNCVTWFGAKAYCEWLGKRLPTEAEWEYAAKSGQNRIYPWGDTPATCENTVMFDEEESPIVSCGKRFTFPIGSKPEGVSAQGVYDLSGHVAEHTNDWYEENFYSTEEASQKDTQGPAEPEENKYKVIRGGSFIYGNDHAKSSFRGSTEPNKPDIDFGFRCVSPAE